MWVTSGHPGETQQIRSQPRSTVKALVDAGFKKKRVKESTRLAEPEVGELTAACSSKKG